MSDFHLGDYNSYEMHITCYTKEDDFSIKKMFALIAAALVNTDTKRLLVADQQQCGDNTDVINDDWISESEAVLLLGYTSAERFRRNVKTKKIPIGFRNVLGRNYQYCSGDIENYLKSMVGSLPKCKRKPKTV